MGDEEDQITASHTHSYTLQEDNNEVLEDDDDDDVFCALTDEDEFYSQWYYG